MLALLVLTGIGFLIIPPLVTQVTEFVDAVPDFIDDLTAGEGPLGWLQDEYQIVDRIREAIEEQGAGGVLGLGAGVLDIVRSVVTAVVGVDHDHLPHVLHAPRGPADDPGRHSTRCRRVSGRATSASVATSTARSPAT